MYRQRENIGLPVHTFAQVAALGLAQ